MTLKIEDFSPKEYMLSLIDIYLFNYLYIYYITLTCKIKKTHAGNE